MNDSTPSRLIFATSVENPLSWKNARNLICRFEVTGDGSLTLVRRFQVTLKGRNECRQIAYSCGGNCVHWKHLSEGSEAPHLRDAARHPLK